MRIEHAQIALLRIGEGSAVRRHEVGRGPRNDIGHFDGPDDALPRSTAVTDDVETERLPAAAFAVGIVEVHRFVRALGTHRRRKCTVDQVPAQKRKNLPNRELPFMSGRNACRYHGSFCARCVDVRDEPSIRTGRFVHAILNRIDGRVVGNHRDVVAAVGLPEHAKCGDAVGKNVVVRDFHRTLAGSGSGRRRQEFIRDERTTSGPRVIFFYKEIQVGKRHVSFDVRIVLPDESVSRRARPAQVLTDTRLTCRHAGDNAHFGKRPCHRSPHRDGRNALIVVIVSVQIGKLRLGNEIRNEIVQLGIADVFDKYDVTSSFIPVHDGRSAIVTL